MGTIKDIFYSMVIALVLGIFTLIVIEALPQSKPKFELPKQTNTQRIYL